MKFCPKCENYLYLNASDTTLLRECRTCGYKEEDTEGGIVMETIVQERTSEGYKILLNEYTREDPTLPHVKTLPCPRATCPSNPGATGPSSKPRDVIIIKYDAQNMKFLYICNVCGEQWRSRS